VWLVVRPLQCLHSCRWWLEQPPRAFRLEVITHVSDPLCVLIKFEVSRPSPMIWPITYMSIILSWKLLWYVMRGTDNLPATFGASVTFLCWAMGKHASNRRHYNLDLWPFRLMGMSVMQVIVLHPCAKFEVHRSSGWWRYDGWFSVTVKRPGDLYLWPLNRVTGHPYRGLPSCQLSASYALPFST